MKDVICAYRKYFLKWVLNIKYAQFSPLFTGAMCEWLLPIAAEKLIYKCLMTSFVHTGSTLLKHEISRIKSSIHWRKLRINIAYSSGEIKLWKFQWRHSAHTGSTFEKVVSAWNMQNLVLYSLEQTAHIYCL